MRWRRKPQVLWRSIPGYLVLANLDGETIEVAGPGVDLWEQLASWIGEEELTAALARQYGAEIAAVSSDVLGLLHELDARGFVDRQS